MMVWIDCEMTGLNLETDALIEVAVLVTDGQLNVQGEGLDVLIPPSEQCLAQMNETVVTMHTKSGLLNDLKSATLTMAEAEDQVLDYIKRYVPEPHKAPLAGNTIGTDRTFLVRDMPKLEEYLHYRNVDVSSIKELARCWYPKACHNAPAKNGNHRALADIQESIEELRYYRDTVFVAQPGPSTQDAKAAAAKHQGELTGIKN